MIDEVEIRFDYYNLGNLRRDIASIPELTDEQLRRFGLLDEWIERKLARTLSAARERRPKPEPSPKHIGLNRAQRRAAARGAK